MLSVSCALGYCEIVREHEFLPSQRQTLAFYLCNCKQQTYNFHLKFECDDLISAQIQDLLMAERKKTSPFNVNQATAAAQLNSFEKTC